MELSTFQQSAVRDLLERGFYEAAYKESKLDWHPVDTQLPVEEIIKQTDEKFLEVVGLFYKSYRLSIFEQIDPLHSSMFLRHIQYEYQINKIRNAYLDLLRKTIEQSIHKGYMFTENLSKQIDSDKDPTKGITAIGIEIKDNADE